MVSLFDSALKKEEHTIHRCRAHYTETGNDLLSSLLRQCLMNAVDEGMQHCVNCVVRMLMLNKPSTRKTNKNILFPYFHFTLKVIKSLEEGLGKSPENLSLSQQRYFTHKENKNIFLHISKSTNFIYFIYFFFSAN